MVGRNAKNLKQTVAPTMRTQKTVVQSTKVNGSKQQALSTIIRTAGEEDEVEVLEVNLVGSGKTADEAGTGTIKVAIGC